MIFLLLFLGFVSHPVLAKEEVYSEFPISVEETIEDKHSDNYLRASAQNISKLYWLKEKVKLDNDKAVDNFILINECDFYNKHIKDDFKWFEIRAAARSLLTEQIPTYSDKYKLMIPIDLGRYDQDKKGFPFLGNTALRNLRRIEVGGNSESICEKGGEIDFYPRSLFLILNQPLTYDFLALNEELAQAYVVRNNANRALMPKSLKNYSAENNRKINRLAFLRLRMTFIEYQDEIENEPGKKAAMMFGKIDGVDVFEYANETGLLSTIDFK